MKLLLQFFGGGNSGAGGAGAGGSKQATKGAFSTAPGVHGSAGGTGTGSGSAQQREKEEEKKYYPVPSEHLYEYTRESATKIDDKNAEYFLRQYRSSTNQPSNYGVLNYEETKEILKGYKYDEKYGMWYTPRGNRGFEVYKVRRKR